MSLLKFFLNHTLVGQSGETTDTPPWANDPLRHPEVERMSIREIADLPLSVAAAPSTEARPSLAKCA